MTQKVTAGLKALIDRNDEKWLATAVDAYLDSSQEGNRRDAGWFHPSALASKCDAYLAFEFLGAPQDPWITARLRRIFDNGHGRDGYWKRYLAKAKLSQVKKNKNGTDKRYDCFGCDNKRVTDRHVCVPSVRLRGEFDDRIINPHNKEESIFEFKTKNDALWKRLKGEPDYAHTLQVTAYMAATGVQRGMVVYENKNDQQVKQINVFFDHGLWTTMIQRLSSIVEQLQNGWEPQRVPDRCDECAYQTVCRKPGAFQNLPKWIKDVEMVL